MEAAVVEVRGSRIRGRRTATPVLAVAAVTALTIAGYRLLARRRSPPRIPRSRELDSTLAVLKEGYTFIPTRCRALGTDVFATRLMLQRVICMSGEEAARVFYEPDRFTRRRAVPLTALLLLQDLGSVQTLDESAHRHRKQMFLSLLTRPADVQHLVDVFNREWRASIKEWARLDRVTLHDAVRQILCRAVCSWAGVPLKASEVAARTRELGAMIDGSGSIGPRSWRGHMLRRRTERWTGQLIDDIRSGRRLVPRDSIASAMAWHFEPNGELMPTVTAAVELINVLRPTIAVARLITFAALALHEHPAAAAALRGGDEVALERFVQEVRRFYPFCPAVGGRVKLEFTWRGHRFTKGTWVLLDLHGTNHDPRIWERPDVFRPARFVDAEPGPFAFIPQGGGHPLHGHRCPGEDIAVELTSAAVRRLLELDYDVPEQDLRIDMSSVPAKPASGFIMSGVRPAARASRAARRGLPPRRSS